MYIRDSGHKCQQASWQCSVWSWQAVCQCTRLFTPICRLFVCHLTLWPKGSSCASTSTLVNSDADGKEKCMLRPTGKLDWSQVQKLPLWVRNQLASFCSNKNHPILNLTAQSLFLWWGWVMRGDISLSPSCCFPPWAQPIFYRLKDLTTIPIPPFFLIFLFFITLNV